MDAKLMQKLADVPLARPGFEALTMSAPVILQMNPEGKWEKNKPDTLDEDRLKALIQHLVKSKAVDLAQSYCTQCAAENKNVSAGKSNYIPVIMMPIYSADNCPFDMDCEIAKMKEGETVKKSQKNKTMASTAADADKAKDSKKVKKRVFQLQRLTDFDLLSQW